MKFFYSSSSHFDLDLFSKSERSAHVWHFPQTFLYSIILTCIKDLSHIYRTFDKKRIPALTPRILIYRQHSIFEQIIKQISWVYSLTCIPPNAFSFGSRVQVNFVDIRLRFTYKFKNIFQPKKSWHRFRCIWQL